MKKLFTILGSSVLYVLVWLLSFFIYPVSLSVSIATLLIGLFILVKTDLAFRYVVADVVLSQSDEFEIPLWYSAYFVTLLILLAIAVYAGHQMKAAEPYAAGVIAWRFISSALLGSAVISFLHWKSLEADLFQAWRRNRFSRSSDEVAETGALEQTKQQA